MIESDPSLNAKINAFSTQPSNNPSDPVREIQISNHTISPELFRLPNLGIHLLPTELFFSSASASP